MVNDTNTQISLAIKIVDIGCFVVLKKIKTKINMVGTTSYENLDSVLSDINSTLYNLLHMYMYSNIHLRYN